jgi:hypothetical protein
VLDKERNVYDCLASLNECSSQDSRKLRNRNSIIISSQKSKQECKGQNKIKSNKRNTDESDEFEEAIFLKKKHRKRADLKAQKVKPAEVQQIGEFADKSINEMLQLAKKKEFPKREFFVGISKLYFIH